MFEFVQNQDTIVRKLSMAKLGGTFGAVESSGLGGHLLKYEHYKVLQELNITGYIPPPPVVEQSEENKPKPRISAEDFEVPWIQAPTAAWIQGRDFVSPDDVQEIMFDALRHRILLSFEAEASGITPDKVLETIRERVPSA